MTEVEWLASAEPWKLLHSAHAQGKGRKLRLIACACFRRFWGILKNPSSERKAVEIAELFADGIVDKRELQQIHRELTKIPSTTQLAYASIAVELVAQPRLDFSSLRAGEVVSMLEAKAVAARGVSLFSPDYNATAQPERQQQAAIIRDILGNPFKPVSFDPHWRTTTAVAVALGVYELQAFERMPILADALQDAGCDSEDLLNHLRDPSATHVRGCWALDLVLDKQ